MTAIVVLSERINEPPQIVSDTDPGIHSAVLGKIIRCPHDSGWESHRGDEGGAEDLHGRG
jgi:hypothetical protein